MKLIALTGKMGAGKSTVVSLIKELQYKPVYLLKFAAPLYDIQEYVYKTINKVYQRPSTFIKDRKLLQWLGTEFGRSIDENLWVKLWKRELEYVVENYPNSIVICDDLRFDNEADMIKSVGGYIIRIESDKNEKRIDIKAGITGHPSESGIDLNKVDYIVENNGTIDDLKTTLLTLNAKLALW